MHVIALSLPLLLVCLLNKGENDNKKASINLSILPKFPAPSPLVPKEDQFYVWSFTQLQSPLPRYDRYESKTQQQRIEYAKVKEPGFILKT